jgi:xanthine dehydrogenase accessory factor
MATLYQALAHLEEIGGSGALCTIIAAQGSTPRQVGSKMLVYPGGAFAGTIGGGEMESRVLTVALQVIETEQPQTLEYSMTDPTRGDPGVCGGQLKIFVEPILPKPLIVVVGAGHVGLEVVHLAKWLGYRVALADDRAELCSPKKVPEADEYYPGPLQDLLERLEFAPQTSFVLTTRNVEVDVAALPGILARRVDYIGVIGSRRRWATTTAKLLEMGIDADRIDAIHSPIGLNLKAETPREIAVSILAEIMALQKTKEY